MKKLLLILMGFGLLGMSHGQIKFPSRTATDKTNQAIDETVSSGIDAVSDGIGSIFKKKDKKEKKKKKNKKNSSTSKSGNDYGYDYEDYGDDGDFTDFSEYEGSDFLPGKDVIFFDDFSTSRLGEGTGNWWTITKEEKIEPSIVTLSGSSDKWLRTMEEGYYFPNDLGALPTDVTIEFDAYADNDELNENYRGFEFQFFGNKDRKQMIIDNGVFVFQANYEPKVIVNIHPHPEYTNESRGVLSFEIENRDTQDNKKLLMGERIDGAWNPGEVNHIAIARKGNGLQVFVNGREFFNESNVFTPGVTYYPLFRSLQWYENTGMYITNVRVGTNSPNAAQDMKNEGVFVTNAIYFDTASSRIKAESWATLNNVAQAIQSTSGPVQILGHTDSDGSDQANLVLSQKRAASVKNALVHEFGIDPERLTTDGRGEAEPVADNSTKAGKAQNRRVEFHIQ